MKPINKSGLNDSDKLFVTIALWISMIALFATALTLPMLPERVTIFYKTTDMHADYYSKYNNILLVLTSIIPAIIVIISASLRKRNRMRHNFPSVILFCVILSACMAAVDMYGIAKQFESSPALRRIDNNAIIALTLSLLLSMGSAALPMVFDTPAYTVKISHRSLKTVYFCDALDRHWNVGAYGYLVAAIIGSFMTGGFSYIPLAVFLVGHVVAIYMIARTNMRHSIEAAVYDALEN